MSDRWDNSSQKFGAFSGDGGAAQDDSIKASLDVLHTNASWLVSNIAVIDKASIKLATKTLVDWTAAAQPLFTITGGPIRVIGIIGTILVDLRNISMSLSIVGTVTTPSASVNIASALQCQDDLAGAVYQLNATFGSILVVTDVGIIGATGGEFIMPIGGINMTSDAIENTGGSIRWDILYRRMSPASTLIAVV